MRSSLMALTICLGFGFSAVGQDPSAPVYTSPYSVEFTYPIEDLIPDIEHGSRADPRKQSRIPFDQWYTEATKKRFGAWGPPGFHHPVPDGSEVKPGEWKRQRVIAVAQRYIGFSYQHHYLPDFDPPADWPWKQVGRGENCRGVDCSNLTTFVYNLALGLKPDSGIVQQSEMKEVRLSDGRTVKCERIERPAKHADFSKVLKTADLLFIKNTSGNISHVVLWVGSIGRSPDKAPLILDSTGQGRIDSNGNPIPDGVHLRPFTPTGWYFNSASHALRLIP
jgi:cell wall-associated NlpC family hydrolase